MQKIVQANKQRCTQRHSKMKTANNDVHGQQLCMHTSIDCSRELCMCFTLIRKTWFEVSARATQCYSLGNCSAKIVLNHFIFFLVLVLPSQPQFWFSSSVSSFLALTYCHSVQQKRSWSAKMKLNVSFCKHKTLHIFNVHSKLNIHNAVHSRRLILETM